VVSVTVQLFEVQEDGIHTLDKFMRSVGEVLEKINVMISLGHVKK